MVDPRLAVGGIQEHVEGRGVGQRAVGERGDLGVQLGEDPRHLVLGDAGIGAQGLDRVIDLAGGGAVQIGLLTTANRL
jgi:hypothetical protein